MGRLDGKYAIVTGGSKGIGEAIAQRFLEEDVAGLAILARNGNLAAETAKKLDPTGQKVISFSCDVGNEQQVAEVFKAIIEKFGTVDILVNNAGITKDAMFHKMTTDQWNAVINVNLNSLYYTCKQVVPLMREKGYGRIINITSTSAWGNIGQANYAATKGGVISFTKTLAKELGPKGITVNCIAPGYIETDMFETVPKNIVEEWLKSIPLRRLGQPSEIAGAAAFLASDDASYMTSQCLVISGGSL